MMMKQENIKQLLNKYFQGETSLLEEKQLRHYFLFEETAPEFKEFKVLFSVFEEEKKITSDIITEDLPIKNKTRIFILTKPIYWSAAAVVLILLSLSWFFNSSTNEAEMLNHQEILIAQKYLSLGFETMDKSYQQSNELMNKTAIISSRAQEVGQMGYIYQKNTGPLIHVNRIDHSLEKLQNISSLKKSKLKLVM